MGVGEAMGVAVNSGVAVALGVKVAMGVAVKVGVKVCSGVWLTVADVELSGVPVSGVGVFVWKLEVDRCTMFEGVGVSPARCQRQPTRVRPITTKRKSRCGRVRWILFKVFQTRAILIEGSNAHPCSDYRRESVEINNIHINVKSRN